MVESPDEVVLHPLERCVFCHCSLEEVLPLTHQRRQVIDLPARRAHIVEHQTECKWCHHCFHLTQSSFPQGITAPVQYGPALGALAVYLVQQHLLPYGRTRELLKDLFGVSMSVATLKAMMEQCSCQLAPVETLIKEALSLAEVLH